MGTLPAPSDAFSWFLFGVSVATSVFLALRYLHLERKLESRKKQLQRDLKLPGMETLRGFLKPKLKELGVRVDEGDSPKN